MGTSTAVWSCSLALALWAGWLDWRSRRIPNWLTVPGFVVGLGVNGVFRGWAGVISGIEGAGLALALLFLPVMLRGMGAGDWKLMGALGAFLGPWNVVQVLFVTIMIAGLMAIMEIIRKRHIKETLHNLGVMMHAFITFGLRPGDECVTLDSSNALRLPFGVAAALAMVFMVCAQSALKLKAF
jgi:prepilin peptidase CpaA